MKILQVWNDKRVSIIIRWYNFEDSLNGSSWTIMVLFAFNAYNSLTLFFSLHFFIPMSINYSISIVRLY